MDFHRFCDKKGWTLTIVETTEDFIFGGFTTAEWESPPGDKFISKPDPHSFLFSVNQACKYPFVGAGPDKNAIGCWSGCCARFGTTGYWDLGISYYNNSIRGFCSLSGCFKLPAA